MKKQIFYLSAIAVMLVACGGKTSNTEASSAAQSTAIVVASTVPGTATAPTSWLDDFKAFRDAIYQGNKEAVATYFDFPLKGTAGENMGYIINASSGKEISKEQFIKHFDLLFDKSFINTLLKIKTDDLLNNGKFKTQKITSNEDVSSMDAEFNKSQNTLRLTLNQMFKSDPLHEEAATFWDFEIKENKLKFKDFQVAG